MKMSFNFSAVCLVCAFGGSLLLSGCGGGSEQSNPATGASSPDSSQSSNSSGSTPPNSAGSSQPVKYGYQHKGVVQYAAPLATANYQLTPMTDSRFNQLSAEQRLWVADKLLTTMFYGMPIKQLQTEIESGAFISRVQAKLAKTVNPVAELETQLNDTGPDDETFNFYDSNGGAAEVAKILARFYLYPELDQAYLQHWMAYVLTSNIMFSPAYELASSHAPNVDRVYNRLVRNMRDEATMGYSTYLHMTSDDNWRRFRSPEDNGREMMEIYLFDFDDTHVPIAGKALKNWRLDRDHDTLVIGLDENEEPLSLFNTTIYNGDDFYSALVQDSAFIPGLSRRLVEVYFSTMTKAQQDDIVAKLVASQPKRWQDLLLQIVMSEAYLLNADKPKSAEEVFLSNAKKLQFQHNRGFFPYFASYLTKMNQASMRYKLGKYSEVPLDTQSFITYHKFVREQLLLRYKASWSSGWSVETLAPDSLFSDVSAFEYSQMVETLIRSVFLTVIARPPTDAELTMLRDHMIKPNGKYESPFRIFNDNDDTSGRLRTILTTMEYLSRLTETYRFKKVN